MTSHSELSIATAKTVAVTVARTGEARTGQADAGQFEDIFSDLAQPSAEGAPASEDGAGPEEKTASSRDAASFGRLLQRWANGDGTATADTNATRAGEMAPDAEGDAPPVPNTGEAEATGEAQPAARQAAASAADKNTTDTRPLARSAEARVEKTSAGKIQGAGAPAQEEAADSPRESRPKTEAGGAEMFKSAAAPASAGRDTAARPQAFQRPGSEKASARQEAVTRSTPAEEAMPTTTADSARRGVAKTVATGTVATTTSAAKTSAAKTSAQTTAQKETAPRVEPGESRQPDTGAAASADAPRATPDGAQRAKPSAAAQLAQLAQVKAQAASPTTSRAAPAGHSATPVVTASDTSRTDAGAGDVAQTRGGATPGALSGAAPQSAPASGAPPAEETSPRAAVIPPAARGAAPATTTAAAETVPAEPPPAGTTTGDAAQAGTTTTGATTGDAAQAGTTTTGTTTGDAAQAGTTTTGTATAGATTPEAPAPRADARPAPTADALPTTVATSTVLDTPPEDLGAETSTSPGTSEAGAPEDTAPDAGPQPGANASAADGKAPPPDADQQTAAARDTETVTPKAEATPVMPDAPESDRAAEGATAIAPTSTAQADAPQDTQAASQVERPAVETAPRQAAENSPRTPAVMDNPSAAPETVESAGDAIAAPEPPTADPAPHRTGGAHQNGVGPARMTAAADQTAATVIADDGAMAGTGDDEAASQVATEAEGAIRSKRDAVIDADPEGASDTIANPPTMPATLPPVAVVPSQPVAAQEQGDAGEQSQSQGGKGSSTLSGLQLSAADGEDQPNRIQVNVLRRETHFAPIRGFDLKDAAAAPQSAATSPMSSEEVKLDAQGEIRGEIRGEVKTDARSAATPIAATVDVAERRSERAAAFAAVEPAFAGLAEPGAPTTGTLPNLTSLPMATATQVSRAITEEAARMQSGEPAGPNTTTQGPVRILEMAVTPDALGRVVIRMRLTSTGLEVQVRATEPATAQMLAQDRDALMRILEGSGVKVDNLDIVKSASSPVEASVRPNWSTPQAPAAATEQDHQPRREQERNGENPRKDHPDDDAQSRARRSADTADS